MSSVHSSQISPFQLEGQFIGFIYKSNGQSKFLRLAVGERELRIKLDKSLRNSQGLGLIAGDWISIAGEQAFEGSFTKLKLKAYEVNRLSCKLECKTQDSKQTTPITQGSNCQKKGKILLCNKSDCAKNGGRELFNTLEKTLCNLGLQDHVTIEKTSCQHRCGKAPNLILMPGKARHSKPNPQTISELLEDHYLNSLNNHG
ncbi:(2Fe-2S) ferredoxin domain-containing protein [Crocosphaera sp. XPORK-15E]|uniref:(2Fe-2S) ferredoxin domain-containing protein n=1 Tax=Crocosphaera sp. XPORK-15E TaxID=3110247 RepID=UPI002B216762|nr:(2Fe-2S) ferredoxin domain-containing protein [Crocosphaera sp. XPORK-15E]MEA5533373.1 (2Fe-2S) ferredoxin domain-containing protein [Crocosphaera sp. XPORK-15E]